jgi:hypothetical protein
LLLFKSSHVLPPGSKNQVRLLSKKGRGLVNERLWGVQDIVLYGLRLHARAAAGGGKFEPAFETGQKREIRHKIGKSAIIDASDRPGRGLADL